MYTVLAERAGDLQTKNHKLNKDRFDVLSIPIYVIKKGPSHGARHGNTERERIYYAADNAARMARKKKCKSILDRFLKSPRYQKSQTDIGWDEEFCARYDTIAAEDLSSIATQAERSRNVNSWKLVPKTSVRNGPMDQRDDCQEAERTHERLTVCGAWTGQHQTPPQGSSSTTNNLLVPKRGPSVSTPKRVGGGTTIHQQVLHPQAGKQLHGGNLHHGMSDIFFNGLKVFSLTGNGDSLQATGSVHRTPNAHAMSRSRTRDFSRAVFFVSRVSACQRLSHVQHVHVAKRCVLAKTFVFTQSAARHTLYFLL